MTRPYPKLETGQPVPVEELGLAPSRLNAEKEKSWNLHHYWYESGFYKQDFIFNSLRNLKGEHVRVLKDQHNLGNFALHKVYGNIKPPTYEYAMTRLEQAIETDEPFEVWNNGSYRELDFDRACWAALKRYYDKVSDHNGVLVFDMAAD